MTKTISLIGSTGSIGIQTLDVAAERGYQIAGLAAGRNIDALEAQILRWKPRLAAVYDAAAASVLANRLKGLVDTEICHGAEGVCRVASMEESDLVVNAAVGIAGLRPTVAAVCAGKT